ncbi:hypothetical protein D9619_012953 [Psilocybe cf. subviscida]|uniref:Major facilitator superfamily (MFS) profile domain-containing protein n=1 Tax=Psilocybe cf. subviscida TaxID=2480587 RepID=A0A8H5BIZ6_9AGAR|nr:hypothetical protein D9619_012953 [Psilocybe cf. subviscida]
MTIMTTTQHDSIRQHARDRQMPSVHGSEPEPKSSLTSTADEKHFSEKDTSEAQVLPPKDIVCTPPEQDHDGDFPDGGTRAWLIVVGAMCSTFSTFGYVNSWGIFQGYYQETLLSSTPPSNIAWIGSIQYSLVFLPALIVGRFFDLGYFRVLYAGASATIVIATFLIAQCTQYWHFLLCQGIMVGLGAGGIFCPTSAVVTHWFKKRRGFAFGMVAVGSSIGGTVLPIVAKNLLPRVGFQWTIRIFGFILLCVLGVSNILLRRRLPPVKVKGGLLNLAAFKDLAYTVYCLSAFTIFLGIYTLLTYVSVTATRIGIPPDFAFYFVAIGNASSLFGRFAAGSLSDMIGPMNVMIPFTTFAAVVAYCWPFAETKTALIVVTVIYGFNSGAYVALLSNPIMEMGSTSDIGRRTGMCMSILALGALAGPPIAGAINTATGGFKAVGYYAGGYRNHGFNER